MGFASPFTASSDTGASEVFSTCSISAGALINCGSSRTEVTFGESRATAFGRAGIIGTAGKADLVGLGATGVVSPGAGNEGCWVDDGVVGFVDSAASEAGWLVYGVSGWGI